MSWKQIKARSLESRVSRKGGAQRVLVTWRTDAGEMFVHGMMASGPSKDHDWSLPKSDSLFFRMQYPDRPDRQLGWKDCPKATYGFRPMRPGSGADRFLSGAEMGINLAAEYNYFEVPTGRKNLLRFFIPAADGPDKLYELPGPGQMYDCMVDNGWEPREAWANRIKLGLDHYVSSGKMSLDTLITEVLPKEELEPVKAILLSRLPELIEMDSAPDCVTPRQWYSRLGQAQNLEYLCYTDYFRLVGDFCDSLYSVPNRNRYSGEEPLFPENYEFLQASLATLNSRWNRLKAAERDEAVVERTSDAKWAAEVEKRWHFARGNPFETWKPVAPDAETEALAAT